MPSTRFILVRHGQTEWNRVERFRGQADVPLNDVGLAQAEATGERIAAQWQPAAIYASPLSRAVKTAESIARRFDLQVQTHRLLIDINYGEWQGLSPDEVIAKWPAALEAWYKAPGVAEIPSGETLNAVRARGLSAVRELADLHEGATLVLVGHTVINRLILLAVLGLGTHRFWHIGQDTCAINVFETLGHDFILKSLNDTCHLHALAHN